MALLTGGLLLPYVARGPERGNPIGLGLLATVGLPAAICLAVAGAVHAVVEYLSARGR